ncbi:MAG TPA: efflux RND transporter periplasmic adaptor subunit [bacterium]|nr:efflux RND transporter periplasmic adaptor subunit [bacterium]
MKPRKPVIIVAVSAAAVALVWFLFLAGKGSDHTLTISGTIEATEARLGFQSAGRIDSIYVREGDSVSSGATLAVLDRAEAMARRDQAAAQVAAARALLTELESGFRSEEVAQARAAAAAAEQQFRDAERDLARTRTLFDGGAVSQETLDKTQTRHDVAENQWKQATEQLRLLERGPRAERIEAQRAQLTQAEAALRGIDATLDLMVVRAEFPGIVTTRHREPGEIVAPGAPVLTIINRDDRWIRVYVPENRLGALRLGQSAAITADTYPGKEYRGEVIYIAPEAEFTPKTVQTTEERVKLVYAVKVRVLDDPGYELKPGMPADVRIAFAQP